MIRIKKYEVCFLMGNGDAHVREVNADGYDCSSMGEGMNSVPSVVFERMEKDPEEPDGDDVPVPVFEISAGRVIYIAEIADPGEPAEPDQVAALTTGEPFSKADMSALGES